MTNVPDVDLAVGGQLSQHVIVPGELARLSQVDEGADAGVEKFRQLLASVVLDVGARIFTGEELAVDQPVGVGDRTARIIRKCMRDQ